MRRIDITPLIGTKQGKLTLLGEAEPLISTKGRKIRRLHCLCDCGKETNPRLSDWRARKSCSCGDKECLGFKKHPYNRALRLCRNGMIRRCHNPKCAGFYNYGGRGITVCNEWRESRDAFVQWALANGFEPHLQLDRIDNNGGYSPDNCRWVTIAENNLNKRTNKRYFIAGKQYESLKEAAEGQGICEQGIIGRCNVREDCWSEFKYPQEKDETNAIPEQASG